MKKNNFRSPHIGAYELADQLKKLKKFNFTPPVQYRSGRSWHQLCQLIDARLTQCLFVACSLLLSTPAIAQEPSEEVKKTALMEAYRLNGNSMQGWGAIDLSPAMKQLEANAADAPVKCYEVKGEATGKTFFECPQPPKPVKVIPIIKPQPQPQGEQKVAATPEQAKDMAIAPLKERNVCTQHGLRKVWSRGGTRWNCRK